MPNFPDVKCWIKLIDGKTGKACPDGTTFLGPSTVVVRYVVANDSHQPAGPFYVVGALRKNGVVIKPGGQPNVVPAQQITVPPNQIWKGEYRVTDNPSGADTYVATMLGDVGGFVVEEDEKNNKANASFTISVVIK
jgi:hypothetical protein